ncbi:hypothetical protein BDW42DRAFT_170747 [Aspergillus taichungensis]|uniref:Uncharacterized protein n=1 Tax=Aspergillus taichungensis TaxID=482145 RepID=A0A2J5HTD0_9EURO|nr:hypothetical protein BDW42DRAFT_170747 [Aspergillus taichungensis]
MFPRFLILLFSFLLIGTSFARVAQLPAEDSGESEPRSVFPRDGQRISIDVYRDESVRPPPAAISQSSGKLDTWMWSALARFDVKINDGQTVQVAKDAYQSMKRRWLEDKIKDRRKPRVMTALRKDDKVYLASSARSTNLVVYTEERRYIDEVRRDVPKPLADALAYCYNTHKPPQRQHMYQGHCGEMMAAWAYFAHQASQGEPVNDLQGAVFVTWEEGLTRAGKQVERIKDPCAGGSSDPWGCNQVLKSLGATWIDRRTKGQDYPEPRDLFQKELLGQCNLKKSAGMYDQAKPIENHGG